MASIGRITGILSRTCQQPQVFKVLAQRSFVTDAGHTPRNVFIQHPNAGNGFPNHFWMIQQRHMSNKNFIQKFIDEFKADLKKSKEMKDSIKKFKDETQKLEDSDALKQARKKFETIEEETLKSSATIKKTLDDIKGKVSETVEEAQKQEFVKKGIDITSSAASKTAETISKTGQAITGSDAFNQITKGVKAAKDEFDEATLSRAQHYRAPKKLRKRTDTSSRPSDMRPVDADDESTGVVLHKDSKFFESWQNFKDNNQYVNKMFDLKVKYDESDNAVVRGSRFFTDKVGQLFGSMFTKTEMSEVLTEICKIDPNFDQEKFIKLCETLIIPNVLEALIRGDLEILKDWSYEAPYNTLAHPIEQAKKAGYYLDSKVLDVTRPEIMTGKIMDPGPVLVINFTAQQIMTVRNSKGEVVEGDPDKVMRIIYVWALCRDQEELDPVAAWRLLDISANSSEQWL